MSHNTSENEVDVLRFIKFGKQDLNTKVEWALIEHKKKWFVANE